VVQSDEAVAVQDLGKFLLVDEEVALQSVAVMTTIGQFGDLGGAAEARFDPGGFTGRTVGAEQLSRRG